MKIAVATMKVRSGACEENFAWMLDKIEEAKATQADMIVFGQNCISGYLLGDQWLDDAWCQYVDQFNDRLIKLSEDIAIVWGNVRYRNHRRFNAAFFAYQGMTHMRVKRNEQSEFQDDARYFEENAINSAIDFKGMVLALNFGSELQLADLNINLDAHAFDLDAQREYKGMVVYTNVCGMQNVGKQVKVMEGGSYVYYQGMLLYEAPYFKADMAIVDLKNPTEVIPQTAELLDAMMLGIQEFDQCALGGKLPWVVGLSGGLDSSVTAALLAMSLGAHRVYGYNMPTNYNSGKTMDNAAQEAEALGIAYHKGSISGMLEAMKREFSTEFLAEMEEPSLVYENMQARTRGFVLNALAAMLGGVVVNNGNMVEAALGYCTLYGDSIGALSPIGDITKVVLIEVARAINERYGKEVIPENLLPVIQNGDLMWEMMPSAELKDAQKDPMKWYYHDAILEMIRQGSTKSDLIKAFRNKQLQAQLQDWMAYYQLMEEDAFLQDLDWFFTTMKRNAFKRVQLPPCMTFHSKTIGATLQSQFQIGKQDDEELRNIQKIKN